MKPPQAIVFDLGKVLVDFDYGITIRRLHAKSRISEAELRQLIDQSPLLYRFETGLLTAAEFFTAVRDATGYTGDFAEFCDCFSDIFSPIDAMIDLHARLREQGLPTYIFSNTNELAVRHIYERYPFFRTFTRHVLSYEHKSMKPDARLYEVVEEYTGHRGADLLYLDDRAENIAAGHARGWQALLHETPQATVAMLRERGVLRA